MKKIIALIVVLLAGMVWVCRAEVVMSTDDPPHKYQYYTIDKRPSFEPSEFFELHGDTLKYYKTGVKSYSHIVGRDFARAFTRLIDTAFATSRKYYELGCDGTTYYAGSPAGSCSCWSPTSGNTARFAWLFASLVSMAENYSDERCAACIDTMRALTHAFATAPPFPLFVSVTGIHRPSRAPEYIEIDISPHVSKRESDSKLWLEVYFQTDVSRADEIEQEYTPILIDLAETALKSGITGAFYIEVDESADARPVIYEKCEKDFFSAGSAMQYRVSVAQLRNTKAMLRLLKEEKKRSK